MLSVLLERSLSPIEGPLWDPYLRIFGELGAGIVELERSDDFARFSLDGFTTVPIPVGLVDNTLSICVCLSPDKIYDPDDPPTDHSLDRE